MASSIKVLALESEDINVTTKKGSLEDSKIVDLFWKRSEQAITETAAKYGKICHSVAYSVLKNNEDSEECVNDTYVRTWNAIPSDRPDHLGAYISKITRRLAIDRYRRSTAEKRAATTVSIFDELSEALPDKAGEGVTDRMVIRDTLNRFTQSLSGTGHCFDNARMESFFATLKKEKIYRIAAYKLTRKQVKSIIFRYIFVYYNRVRISSVNPGGMPPVAYREWAKANSPTAA